MNPKFEEIKLVSDGFCPFDDMPCKLVDGCDEVVNAVFGFPIGQEVNSCPRAVFKAGRRFNLHANGAKRHEQRFRMIG